MSTAQLVPIEALQQQAAPWALRAVECEIASQATLERASSYLHDIKALRKEIADSCDPVIKAAFAAHRAATKQKKDLEAELIEAEGIIKQKIGSFVAELERKQREQEALEAAVEREAREKAEAEARALDAAGEHELAGAARETADIEAAPAPVAIVPKAQGVATRDNWSATVVDLKLLVKAVAAGKVPLAVIQVNQTVLNQQARSLKCELDWPGVSVRNAKVVAVR